MTEEQKPEIMMSPATPILYTDSVLVNRTPFGINLEIAQSLGSHQKQQVVARIGMSLEHAKALLEVMTKVIGTDTDEKKSIGFRTGEES